MIPDGDAERKIEVGGAGVRAKRRAHRHQLKSQKWYGFSLSSLALAD